MSPLPGRGRETGPRVVATDAGVAPSLLEEVAEEAEDALNPVVEHLEAAIGAAEDEGMSAAELIGLLTYYAHNVAQEARETAILAEEQEPRSE